MSVVPCCLVQGVHGLCRIPLDVTTRPNGLASDCLGYHLESTVPSLFPPHAHVLRMICIEEDACYKLEYGDE